MIKIIFLISILTICVSVNESYGDHPYHICTPNNPQDCEGGSLDNSGAPHKKGLQNCDGFSFTNVLEPPVCGRTNSELFIHNGMATSETVDVSYNGMYIGKIDVGATPLGTPHHEWIGIGGQRADIPFWVYYDVSFEGTLLPKGEGYQHVRYDALGSKYWIDPDDTYERTIAYAKYKALIYGIP